MTLVVRRVRAVLGMGLLWAAGMAGVGAIIELLDNVLPGGLPLASLVDMWPQTLAVPGFLGGVIFAVVLMVAGRRTRFHQLSLPRFAAWGALAGALLGAKGVSGGLPAFVIGITSVGGAMAAAGSLLLARRGESSARRGAGVVVPHASLSDGDVSGDSVDRAVE